MNFAGVQLKQRELAYVCAFNTKLKQPVRAELAPLPGFSRETLDQAISEILQAAQGNENALTSPSAAFAWDCLVNGISPAPIPVDIPLLQGQGAQLIQEYQSLNCPDFIKLKVARLEITDELANIASLLALNPKLKLRLDANQGWTQVQAKQFCQQLSPAYIEYIEEPCQGITDALTAVKTSGLGIALDEHLQQPLWPLAEMQDPAIKALIIKPSLVGSFARIQQLLTFAKRQGLRTILSSAFESPYGLGLLAHLANIWTPDEAPGLDTSKYFANSQAADHWHAWPKISHENGESR